MGPRSIKRGSRGLIGAQFEGASLEEAQLNVASFEGAQLPGASLERANIAGTRFAGAQLQGASFNGATVEAASFSHAFLWRTSWEKTNVRAIDIKDVKWEANDFLKARDTYVVSVTSSYRMRSSRPLHFRKFEEYYSYLVDLLKNIGGKRPEEALQRPARLDCKSPHNKTLESCDAAKKPTSRTKEQKILEQAGSMARPMCRSSVRSGGRLLVQGVMRTTFWMV